MMARRAVAAFDAARTLKPAWRSFGEPDAQPAGTVSRTQPWIRAGSRCRWSSGWSTSSVICDAAFSNASLAAAIASA